MPNQTLESIKAPGEILKLFDEMPSIQIGELQEIRVVEMAGNTEYDQE